jgi:hypothetical protein
MGTRIHPSGKLIENQVRQRSTARASSVEKHLEKRRGSLVHRDGMGGDEVATARLKKKGIRGQCAADAPAMSRSRQP